MQFASAVGAGLVDSRVSVPLSRPFRLTHVGFACDTTDISNIAARFLTSTNNDISGAFDSTGTQLDEGAIGTADFVGINHPQHTYPNKIITALPAFIKLLVRNNTAGVVSFQWIANLEWLD